MQESIQSGLKSSIDVISGLVKPNEELKGKEKYYYRRLSSSVTKQSTHHWLPSIHEDYYGPKIHNPRHH